VGALTAAVVAGVGAYSQTHLATQAETIRTREAANAALNHLDTRESELKSDAYQPLIGSDLGKSDLGKLAGDAKDDGATAAEAVAAMDALSAPSTRRWAPR
jgi:methyl-accepting chemotaxis protein